MNEPLFEFVKHPDPEDLRLLYRYIYFRRPGIWILFVVLVILEGLGLWRWLFLRDLSWSTVFSLFYPPVVLIILFFQYKRTIKVQQSRLEEVSSAGVEDKPVVYRFFDDHFTYETRSSTYSVSYSKLKKTLVHGEYLILVTDSKMYYELDRTHFTKGDPQGLLRFLASKGIQ